jgi:hypothetical protein
MKVAGFVLGLIALIFCWLGCLPFVWWLGIIIALIAIAGIVLSAMALSKAKKSGEKAGLAIAGLVLAILGLISSISCIFVGLAATAIFSIGAQQITDQIQQQVTDVLNSLPTPS